MTNSLLERRQRVLGAGSPLFYDEPLRLVEGRGVWVEDADGKRYLDGYNNVPHVGHCHPRVVEAIVKQAEKLNIHTRYLHENVVEYGERLTSTFDEQLSVAMFVCTGTEANDLAIRMSRLLSGGQGLIVTDFSYHGHSITLAEATTGIPSPEAVGPLVRTIHVPDLVREGRADAQSVGEAYVAQVSAALASFREAGIQVAAILVDSLFSTEGLPVVPANYLAEVVALVRQAGGYFIGDEVQPGFGRLGDTMWGYQQHGVVPDFVTMGKPMGNGHPIGGVVTRPDYLAYFQKVAMYFNTFGGNPVSAAAGLAVLDVLEEERLLENATDVGSHLRSGLEALRAKHDLVGVVRGKGLFCGLELVVDRETMAPATAEAKRIVNEMRRHGVLISKIGPHDNVLKIRPPMPFSKDNADLLVSTLDVVLGEVRRG
ncbi:MULTISPECIES: aminotransferase class III-fold pyridoxal phosphate-dependent enzyme [unclassified Sphingobium]|uniref:aminotransferase class III-fold pyridoxal phosphate-dependent enzyme n=1 Tax=unclassified Sphingobium TaxID=2611147 RepID=UPI000D160EBF|nr:MULTISPECIES: aminotransferase class III-fold pyridoxal phosphate-dependent enzyme [unclassified Sphingobium]MBG6120453.1 4-aminobutyrate aminotransferase-like enzyme [Sphingobium sp. JAI105]PSO10048.1 aspartate aminotransferase family protein [Sphingobium sp. AEW4]TWC98944.1 4-aminobutyrate aminotransferase-like enzyme [Sphingobium sp. AEW010]TWD18423.1 4-aminobutyrate aminotransferase-like enzyme [Sphingobium sp. AEW013]TWD21051.1 4-aminobutyrate aminotransferase-like enzyme [Sphingobium 